jgi:hypothetical protein
MQKKILIITNGFYPEQSPRSFRATELTKELVKQGHDVTVMTPSREGLKNLQTNYPFKLISLGNLNWGIFNFKSKSPIVHLFNKFINRAFPLFFEFPDIELYFKVKEKLKKENSTFDLLISIAVPFTIHWGVSSVWNKNKKAKVWVADCGDPYMGNKNDTFSKLFYFHYFENHFLKNADYVTIPFEDLKFRFNSKYQDKFRVIPQGFNFSNIKLREYRKNTNLKIGYVGTIIPGHRHPSELICHLEKLKIDYKFCFFGTNEASVYKETPWNKNFEFYKSTLRENVIEQLSEIDFLVNVMEKKIDGKVAAIPSKLIDYSLTKRPILNYEYQSFDPVILEQFIAEDFTNAYVLQNFENYQIENVVSKFLNLTECE